MMTSDILHNFHFIRPWWLLLIPVAAFCLWWLLVRQQQQSGWKRFIAPELLQPLLQGVVNTPGKFVPIAIASGLVIASLALAGPTWEQLPRPVQKKDNALVIILDLSPSMLAADTKPSRLVAARHKIMDLLHMRKEGNTALVVYSGDAHIVAPLTDDNNTIVNLLDALDPVIMPIYGSNVEDALQQSMTLFHNAGYNDGDILLVTDGVTETAVEASSRIVSGSGYHLSIIGTGTEQGAPIPAGNGGFVKDDKGNILMPQLHAELLKALARNTGGTYSPLRLDDNDILPLVEGTVSTRNQALRQTEREFDQWRDMGVYLCLLLIPFLLAGFRRGALAGLLVLLPLLHTPRAEALDLKAGWDNLWLNDNQRAMQAMEKKDYVTAAHLFHDPQWKARAQYEQGDYASALKQFESDSSANAYYNRGNVLAKSGRLQEAINAYTEALKQKPGFDDAQYNKELVEKLLKKQQQQHQDGEQQQSQPGQDQQQQPSRDSSSQGDTKPDQRQSQSGSKDQQSQQKSSAQDRQQQKHDQANNSSTQDKGKPQDHQSPDNQSQQQQSSPEQSQQQSAQQPKPNDGNDTQAKPSANNPPLTPEQIEKQKALEQWLRKVPDDPSGLLRNKFQYYSEENLRKQQRGESFNNLNNEERW